MTGLFLLGSFWFWALLTTTVILLTYFVNSNDENDGKFATTILILATGLFFFLGNRELFFTIMDFIKNEPLTFLGYVAAYLTIGAVWSIIKWYYFLLDYKKQYLVDKVRYSTVKLTIPVAKKYKADIIMWMSYWTVSLLWTLTHQWVTKIWSTIYSKLESTFNKISSHVFKDMEDDIEKTND